MMMDDVAKQLLREFSKLRAEVRDNGIVVEQMRDELKAVHELVGGVQEQLADVPKRAEFDELRADVKVIKKVVGDQSRELTHSIHEYRHWRRRRFRARKLRTCRCVSKALQRDIEHGALWLNSQVIQNL